MMPPRRCRKNVIQIIAIALALMFNECYATSLSATWEPERDRDELPKVSISSRLCISSDVALHLRNNARKFALKSFSPTVTKITLFIKITIHTSVKLRVDPLEW